MTLALSDTGTALLVAGTVRTADGAPVAGAVVEVDGRTVHSDHAGEFEVLTADHPVALTVRATGSAPVHAIVPREPSWWLIDGTRVVVVDVCVR